MKFLITGASGQLAREFQRRFERNGIEFAAPPECKFDITDISAVRETISAYRPTVVLNCAAYNDVEKAESDWTAAHAVNAEAVSNLAEICEDNGARFVHFSSDYVFDGTKEGFYTEEDAVNPLNNYGSSKLAGERAVRDRISVVSGQKPAGNSHSASHDSKPPTHELQSPECTALILRVSWVYGPGRQNFFYKMRHWAQKNKVLKIVWDQLSVPTFTEDIVTYTLQALDAGLDGIYHLTNSGYASRYETARYFFTRQEGQESDKLILPISTAEFAATATRPFFSKMSNARLSSALDVTIPSWQDALNRFINRGM